MIIDTFARVRARSNRNRNAYEDDYEAASPLQALAGQYGVAILVIHHLRKLASEDPLDLVSGTLGLTGAADSVWVLRRERGRADATMFITGRDIDEQDLALRFDQLTGTWSILGDAEDYRRTKERDEVVQLLRSAGEALSTKEIADRLGQTHGSIRTRLSRMQKDGDVVSADGRYTVRDV